MAVIVKEVNTAQQRPWPLPVILVWLIWRRNRLGFIIACVGLAVMSVLANSLLHGTATQLNSFRPTVAGILSPPGEHDQFGQLEWLLLLVEIIVIPLAYCAVITASLSVEWKIGNVTNQYPQHMLRAPADTIALALWPLAIGVALQLCVWTYEALTILRPMGLNVPLVLPGIALCAFNTLVAASVWTKWSPVVRYLLVAASFAVMALGVASTVGTKYNVWFLLIPPAVAAGIFFAVIGMRKLRSGEQFTWKIKFHNLAISAFVNRASTPPQSGFDAICCLEGRKSRRITGFVLLGTGIASVAAILWLTHSAFAQVSLSHIGNIEYISRAPMLGALAFVTISGGVFSIASFPNLKNLTTYVLCRPEPTQVIVAAELFNGLVCASQLLIVGFVLLVIGLLPIEHYFSSLPHTNSFVPLNPLVRTIKFGAFYALFILLYAYRSALNIASVSLTKSWWAILLNSQVEYFSLYILAMFVIGFPVDSLPHAADVICGIALIRLIVASWIISKVVKKRLVSDKGFLVAGVVWFALASAMYIEAPRFIPLHYAPSYVVMAMVVIAMPLVRLSLSPILLDHVRHR